MTKRFFILFAILASIFLLAHNTVANSISYSPRTPTVGNQVTFSLSHRSSSCVRWDFGDRSPRSDSESSRITHVYTRPGTYQVKAWDMNCDDGGNPTDTVRIRIKPKPKIRISFSPSKVETGKSVSFKLSYRETDCVVWDFGDGKRVSMRNSSSARHTYKRPGRYTVKVWDMYGDYGGNPSAWVKVQVKSGKIKVDISHNPRNPRAGEIVTFSVKKSPSSEITWVFGDGTTEKGGQTIPHVYKNPGNYIVRALVDEGKTGTGKTRIRIGKDLRKITVTSHSLVAGLPVTFKALNFYSDQTFWDFGDGIQHKAKSRSTVEHVFKHPGTYTVKVWDYGRTKRGKATIVLLVKIKGIKITFAPPNPRAGQPVTFRLKNRNLPQVTWDFGDSTPKLEHATSASHTFKRPGNYEIRVFLKRDKAASAKTRVHVGKDIRRITVVPSHPKAGKAVTFRASGFYKTCVSWDFGDGKILRRGLAITRHTFKKPGIYTVKAYDLCGEAETPVTLSLRVTTPSFVPSLARLKLNKALRLVLKKARDANGKTLSAKNGVIYPSPGVSVHLSLRLLNRGKTTMKGVFHAFDDQNAIFSQQVAALSPGGEKTFDITVTAPKSSEPAGKFTFLFVSPSGEVLAGYPLLVKPVSPPRGFAQTPLPKDVRAEFYIEPKDGLLWDAWRHAPPPYLHYDLKNILEINVFEYESYESDSDKFWNGLRRLLGRKEDFYSTKKTLIKVLKSPRDGKGKLKLNNSKPRTPEWFGYKEREYGVYYAYLDRGKKKWGLWEGTVFYKGPFHNLPSPSLSYNGLIVVQNRNVTYDGDTIHVKYDNTKGALVKLNILVENPGVYVNKKKFCPSSWPTKIGFFKKIPKGWSVSPPSNVAFKGCREVKVPFTIRIPRNSMKIGVRILEKNLYFSLDLDHAADITQCKRLTFMLESKEELSPWIRFFRAKTSPIDYFTQKGKLDINVQHVKWLTLYDTATNKKIASFGPNTPTGDYIGTVTVSPKRTTTYKLVAENKYGTSKATATLKVTASKPVIESFYFQPASIEYGQKAELLWSYKNGQDVKIIDKFTGKVITNLREGSHKTTTRGLVFEPKNPLTYTLIVSNPAGKVEKDAKLFVTASKGFWTEKPYIASFTAYPKEVTKGETVTLKYRYTFCERAFLHDLETGKKIADLPVPPFGSYYEGSIKVKPNKPAPCYFYRLFLVNNKGYTYKNIYVVVQKPPQSFSSITAGNVRKLPGIEIERPPEIEYFRFKPQKTVKYKEVVTLSYSYKNAKNAQIIEKPLGKTFKILAPGSHKGRLQLKATHPATYALVVSNTLGKAEKDAKLFVTASKGFWIEKPYIASFTAYPKEVAKGGTVTLKYRYTFCERAFLHDLETGKKIADLPVPPFGSYYEGSIKVKPDRQVPYYPYRLFLINSKGYSYKNIYIKIIPPGKTPSTLPKLKTTRELPQLNSPQKIGGSSTLKGGKLARKKPCNPDNDPWICQPPLIDDFRATPGTIKPGETVTLSWTFSNAGKAEIVNQTTLQGKDVHTVKVGPLGKVVTGSLVLRPRSTTRYGLLISNPHGEVLKSVTVIVGPPK